MLLPFSLSCSCLGMSDPICTVFVLVQEQSVFICLGLEVRDVTTGCSKRAFGVERTSPGSKLANKGGGDK